MAGAERGARRPGGRKVPPLNVEGLVPVRDASDVPLEGLLELYRTAWWTLDRGPDDVRVMLRHSDLVFGYRERESGRLVAFARVLTDRVYRAIVFDVVVAPEFQGRGLGSAVMEQVLGHRDLAGVRNFELYCLPELIPFYERWGFSSDVGGVLLMRKKRDP